eukprot:7787005-Prorocentrum_lima.AAC.1
MTSSLVGSEMCIRDRKKPANAALRAGKPFALLKESSLHFLVSRTTVRSCLLYTSDAADDM